MSCGSPCGGKLEVAIVSATQSLPETSKAQEQCGKTNRNRTLNNSRSRTTRKMEPGSPTVGRSPLVTQRRVFSPSFSIPLFAQVNPNARALTSQKRLWHNIQDQTSATLSRAACQEVGEGKDGFLTRELALALSVGKLSCKSVKCWNINIAKLLRKDSRVS